MDPPYDSTRGPSERTLSPESDSGHGVLRVDHAQVALGVHRPPAQPQATTVPWAAGRHGDVPIGPRLHVYGQSEITEQIRQQEALSLIQSRDLGVKGSLARTECGLLHNRRARGQGQSQQGL